MNHSMINSMVSMNGLQQKLDIMANNMANVNTVGYKRREATFEDILTNMRQQPQGFQREGRLSPLGFNQGWGAKLSQMTTNFAQGTLKDTGNAEDLALEGNGLFKIRVANGDPNQPANNTLYTRDGSFQLTRVENDPDNVYLSTKDGHLVLDAADNPISVPSGYKLSVTDDGRVYAYNGAVPEAGSLYRGQLGIVRVLRPQFMQQVGDNMYTIPAGVAATPQEINNVVQPVGAGSALEQPIKVRQGFLEQSNVDLADEMTELLMVQRGFQLSSRALSSSDTMMNLANNLRT
ncbi:flagellar hook-basal body protein [Gorillibacterium sp. sgz5001074]|uniref:flagellar hook-basal body protein n=1 Tax=Gorillibacterium sp. sgz5001074 TaxID=3446695 RepID=UPI003F672A89